MFYLALVNTIAFVYHILSEFSGFQMDFLGRRRVGGWGGGGATEGDTLRTVHCRGYNQVV